METPNLSYINKISKDDVNFKTEFISVLKNELLLEINNYNKFLSENNLPKTKVYVHRIKHKMSILGLEKSYKLTNEYENSLRENKFVNKSYFENMLPTMISFLNSI